MSRREPRKVLLIFNSHTSHCLDVTVLDLAAENEVILLCPPSHITHNLQSFDSSFFKPLKTYWRQVLSFLMFRRPNHKVSRLHFGCLLNVAWSKASIVGNGTSGFSATGIYPYNAQEIPQHVFAISDGFSNDTDRAYTGGA
ncbi:DDE-1 domain-containing protein [Trichonephila clavipes]|nr:DDE-1 domain-containing protein [Trichonephila clavipes]